MVAPEPYLSACMAVVYRALVHARMIGYSKAIDVGHLADLMDAVHNIPKLVQEWERCDVTLMRAFLKTYDDKWGSAGGLALGEVFDRMVAKGSDGHR